MDNSQLTFLDLCSGLGGASQPAKDRGWRVIRIDIDARFKPDIVADVRHLPLRPFHVDVLWASPPCTEFSRFQMRCFYPDPPEPNLSISLAVRAVIDEFQPRQWIVENVWASRPWLTKIFGPVRARPPGHALWSNQLLMLPNVQPHKSILAEGLTSKGVGTIPARGKKFADYERRTYRNIRGDICHPRPFVLHGLNGMGRLERTRPKSPTRSALPSRLPPNGGYSMRRTRSAGLDDLSAQFPAPVRWTDTHKKGRK